MVDQAGTRFLPPAAALGVRLREIRQKAKLSQAEVARRMGHGSAGYRSLVCRLEKGRISRPGVAVVTGYLTACGASLSDIEDLAPSAPSVSLKKKRVRKPKSREEKLRLVRKRAETLPTELVLEDRLFEWLNDENMLLAICFEFFHITPDYSRCLQADACRQREVPRPLSSVWRGSSATLLRPA